MGDLPCAKQSADLLGIFDRGRTYQDRLALLICFRHLVGSSVVFLRHCSVYCIVMIMSYHRHMCRHKYDFEAVYLLELFSFCECGTCHSGKFFVHPEVVLKRDSCKRLILPAYLYTFFGFNRLVKTVRVPSPKHKSPGEFVNNDNFSVFHDVMNVPLEKMVGFERLNYLV